MSTGELILYRSKDGKAEVQLRVEGETVWLTQAEMAELFQTSVPNINSSVCPAAAFEHGSRTG